MTKLGPHVILATEAAKHWAANAPIVLWAFRPPAAFRPGAITICRPIWMLPRDGKQAAKEILALYIAWGVKPTYTQLWNEFDEWGRNELRERLRQGRIAGDILRANGLLVGDNIASTGTLEEGEWLIAAEEGWGGMDVLFIHEYWGNEGFTTWHALRYRRMHDVVNGNHPKVIVAETGRDRIEGGQGGWKADGVSTEQFVGELEAYDAEIQKDSYILGATVFTAGPTEDWKNYDMDGLEQYLIEEAPVVLVEARVEPGNPAEGSRAEVVARVTVDGVPKEGAIISGIVRFTDVGNSPDQAFQGNTGSDGTVRLSFHIRARNPIPVGTVVPVEVYATVLLNGDAVTELTRTSFTVGGQQVPEYDPQIVMDYWMQQPWLPAEGYNEDDAFGAFLAQYDPRLGAQKCPDLELGGYLFRFYATGILYAKVGDWANVMVAYGIRGLPPKT